MASVLNLPTIAGASLLVYEPFDYPAGAFGSVNGGIGFLGPWADNDPQFSPQTGNLQANGYVSQGNEVHLLASTYATELRHLSGQFGADGTELWASYMLQIKNPGAFTSLGIGYPINGTVNLQFGVLGSSNGTGPPSTTWGMDSYGGYGQVLSQVPVVYGKTARLAVHIQFLPGPDRIDLYVNPASGIPPSSPDATKTDLDLGHTLQLYSPPTIDFASNMGDALFDDVRIGTTYADVVPPPTIGDFNLDGKISTADIQALAHALTDLKSFQSIKVYRMQRS